MGARVSGERLRAAFAYRGLSNAARAELLGISTRHLSRVQREGKELDDDRLAAIVEATRVPKWFFITGFEVAPQPVEPTIEERLEAVENQLAALLRQRAADAPPPPPGVHLHQPPDERSTTANGPLSQIPPAADAPGGTD